MPERRRKSTPEQRTAELFNLSYSELGQQLAGRTIGIIGSQTRMRIDDAEPYAKDANSKRYSKMTNMAPGDVWAFRIALRNMKQFLIVANDDGEAGACVRVTRASSYDHEKGDFVKMPREGDVANLFSLDNDEIARLKFIDDTDVLYLVREQIDSKEQKSPDDQSIKPDNANEQLAKSLKDK